MQRLGGAWLPHLPIPSAKPSSNIQVRFKHMRPWPSRRTEDVAPLRRNYLMFEASPLVLDLDAEDSPYVRPYDEDVDGRPESAMSYRFRKLWPVRKFAKRFEIRSRAIDEASRRIVSDKFSPWRITDYDVLSVAIDNSSQKEQAQHISTIPNPFRNRDNEMDMVIYSNGIPLTGRKSSVRTIAYMRRRQQLSQRLQPAAGDEKSLNDAIRACHQFLLLDRLITSVMQTPQGCQLVSNCSNTLGQRCTILAKKTPPIQVLPFLNNLIMNLDSQDLPVSKSIIWYAHLSSLRCGVFSAAQKYMKRMDSDNYALDGEQVAFTLQAFQESIAPYHPKDTGTRPKVDIVHQLLAAYSLLVGCELGGSKSQASLRHIVYGHSDTSSGRVVACLARLGAFRILWYLWHSDYQRAGDDLMISKYTTEPSDREAPLDVKKGQWKIEKFARAVHRAIMANNRFTELADIPGFARATGDYHRDCQLDMEAIIKSADIISTRGDGKSRQVDGKEMIEIFNQSSIQESMMALQSYLSRIPTLESG
ncbi:hypothetical protein GGR53DRAFT_486697 [Hypoxylon sp. FL1150]|nr:hypothetical protein GGR53DRAFT_486697 [Hypoxylon sp. FL1150]